MTNDDRIINTIRNSVCHRTLKRRVVYTKRFINNFIGDAVEGRIVSQVISNRVEACIMRSIWESLSRHICHIIDIKGIKISRINMIYDQLGE